MARSTLRSETPSGTVSTAGAKLRIELTPAATSWSATSWATAARGGEDRDRDLALLHDPVEVLDRFDRLLAHHLADECGIGVHQRHDPKPAGAEAPVVRQRRGPGSRCRR